MLPTARYGLILLLGCLALGSAAIGCRRTAPPAAPVPVGRVAPSPAAASAPLFADVTTASGVRSTYRNGEESGERAIVESLGGGVGVCDFDRDGRPDLFFPGGGKTLRRGEQLTGLPGTLWRNLGGLQFDDVTAAAGIDQAGYYSHGCAIADFDNDGFPDILVTGYGGLGLFHNQGDGTFLERHEIAGLVDELWSSSAAWGDFDGDGNLDLYVVHYVDWSWGNHPVCPGPDNKRETCSPLDFQSLPDLVYVSNGDGTFRADQAAIGPEATGKGLGVVAADVNHDSRLDVYVANDTTANLLFMNQGGGRFEETGVISGTAFDQRGMPNGSMGLAVLDYDHDLRPDLWVTNYERETFALYHNDGRGFFRCLTESTGISALGTLYVGFGTVAADFTRSGHEDLVVSNGHVMHYPSYSPLAQEPLYVRNDGRGRFLRQRFGAGSYFAGFHRGRGVVAVDLNADGQLDLVFSHINEPAAILQQQSELTGSWLGLQLIGRGANRDAIGARVVLDTSRGKQLRTVVGGGSYLSQNPYTVNFGLPPDTEIRGAEITWPDGEVQILNDLVPGSTRQLIQRYLESAQP